MHMERKILGRVRERNGGRLLVVGGDETSPKDGHGEFLWSRTSLVQCVVR